MKTNNRLEEAGDFESRAYVRTLRVNILNPISIELLLCCYSEINDNLLQIKREEVQPRDKTIDLNNPTDLQMLSRLPPLELRLENFCLQK